VEGVDLGLGLSVDSESEGVFLFGSEVSSVLSEVLEIFLLVSSEGSEELGAF